MRFNEQQPALRDALRRMTDERIRPLAGEVDENDRFPVEWKQLFGEMGVLQMWVPEEYGGPGGDLVSVCIAKEGTARGSLTASTLACNNSIGLILPVVHFGTHAQKAGTAIRRSIRWSARCATPRCCRSWKARTGSTAW